MMFYELLHDDVTCEEEIQVGCTLGRERLIQQAIDRAEDDAADGTTGRYLIRDKTGLARYYVKSRGGFTFSMEDDADLWHVTRYSCATDQDVDLSEDRYQRRYRGRRRMA